MNNKSDIVLFVDLDDTILKGPFDSIVFPTLFNELSNKSCLSTADIRSRAIFSSCRKIGIELSYSNMVV